MSNYYDYVLGLIPVALFGISGLLHAAGFALTTAVPVAATVAVLVVGHALFVNGPIDAQSDDVAPKVGPVNAD